MTLFGVTNLGLFVLAGLILNITPGVDVLYITNRSAAQGKKAGIVAALGIGTGCMVHVVAAALGLSAIMVSSSGAFMAVRYVGAAYLFYLGFKTLHSLRRGDSHQACPLQELPQAKIYRQAILINALNPKVALFFMALLPQFVSPTASHPALTFLFLGLLFNVNGTVVNIMIALGTSMLARKLRMLPLLPRILKSLVGTLFVALGLRLALES